MFGCIGKFLPSNFIYMLAESTNTQDFRSFCTDIREKARLSEETTIYMVLDNASAHDNPKSRKKLRQLNIMPLFMPPYSPELNSIEHLWSVFKNSLNVQLSRSMMEQSITKAQWMAIITNCLDAIPPETAGSLITSNRRAMADVLDSNLEARRH